MLLVVTLHGLFRLGRSCSNAASVRTCAAVNRTHHAVAAQ